MDEELTPELLLRAYAAGIFPMAENRTSSELHWIDPKQRGIFPLDGFHMSRSLKKTALRGGFEPRFNTDFAAVVDACADRDETWINGVIRDLYLRLHASGYAHSQEIWQGDELIGGVYGIALGGCFCGESMFSHRTGGSKLALAWLIDRLCLTGFTLFDTQFLTPHLHSLGAIEISREEYHQKLRKALMHGADITGLKQPQTAYDVIQRNTHTS